MPTCETSVVIAARPEAVWMVLADVVNWPRWTPTVLQVDSLDSDQLAVGNRFRIHQPSLRPSVWKVVAVEPPISFRWESRMPGLVMRADHEIAALPDNSSKVTLRFSFLGLLGFLAGALNRKLVESYIAQEAAGLAKVFEKS